MFLIDEYKKKLYQMNYDEYYDEYKKKLCENNEYKIGKRNRTN